MRFQHSRTPPPWINRRDQYRLLGLVAMLALVMLLFERASRPESWRWFEFLTRQPPPGEPSAESEYREIDMRVFDAPTDPLRPDEFRNEAATPDDSPAPLAATGFDVTQLEPELLAGIQDQQIGRLREEESAQRTILDRLATIPGDELQMAARDDVGYRAIGADPDHYRGALLTIEGKLWQVSPYILDGEASSHFQAWMFTADSGLDPWMVVLNELPPGITEESARGQTVRVTGYFFKRHGYRTAGGYHVAPQLLADTLTFPPAPPVAVPISNGGSSALAWMFIGTIVAGTGAILFWFRRSDAKHRAATRAKSREPVSDDIALKHLRELANAEQQGVAGVDQP